jgi:hypothetical protein
MKEGLIQNDSKPNKRLRKGRVPKVKLEHFQEMEPCGRNYEPYGEIALSSHPQPTSDPHSKLSNTFPLPLKIDTEGYTFIHVFLNKSLCAIIGLTIQSRTLNSSYTRQTTTRLEELPKLALMHPSRAALSSSIFPDSRNVFRFLRPRLIRW